jgi:hypothetical protein
MNKGEEYPWLKKDLEILKARKSVVLFIQEHQPNLEGWED